MNGKLSQLKKPIPFEPFKFGNFQLVEILNSLGGATNHDFFLKIHKTMETKNFFPVESSLTPTSWPTHTFPL